MPSLDRSSDFIPMPLSMTERIIQDSSSDPPLRLLGGEMSLIRGSWLGYEEVYVFHTVNTVLSDKGSTRCEKDKVQMKSRVQY